VGWQDQVWTMEQKQSEQMKIEFLDEMNQPVLR
jgi:hypothetical protein